MDNKHAQTPEHIFERIGKKSFASLSEQEQQQVLQYFTKEEYEELNNAAMLLKDSRQAGSTQAYRPAKTALLKQFDKTYAGPSLFSFASAVWKIAAVCLLFLSGWLCHYLASHSYNNANIMAVIDTVYLAPQTVIKYDTVYIEKTDARQKARPMQYRMQERRDATECQPSQIRPYHTGNPMPRKPRGADDSIGNPLAG